MKILVCGYHNPNFLTITEYIEKAIRTQGLRLYVFNDRNHLFPGRIRRRFPFLNRLSIQRINHSLIKMISRQLPDLVLVVGGSRILESTILKLKGLLASVLWTTDPPIDFGNIEIAAKAYDHVFCQGTEAVKLLTRQNVIAHWLPMACDPGVHHPVKLTPKDHEQYGNDLAFVGSYYPNRYELFKKLSDFDFGIWGPGWDKKESSEFRLQLRGKHMRASEWTKIYSASKIVLAPHFQDVKNEISVFQASPRVFEAMACGAFVISDYQRDVFALFKDGEHLVGFKTVDELIDKIRYYLSHPVERKEIALRGRQEVLNNHKYINRIEKLLSIVSGNCSDIHDAEKSITYC